MKHLTTAVRDLARQVLAYEAERGPDSADIAGAEGRACAKVQLYLLRLVGDEGFAALFSRAVTLARADVPWLTGVNVRPDSSLEALQEAAASRDRAEAAEGYEVVLGHVLALLALFIGETLTLRLVHDVWPDIPLDASILNSNAEEER